MMGPLIEQTATGFSGYFPDAPGFGAAHETREGLEELLRDGLAFHLEGDTTKTTN